MSVPPLPQASGPPAPRRRHRRGPGPQRVAGVHRRRRSGRGYRRRRRPRTKAPAKGGCDSRNNNTYEKLLECMTVEGVHEHLQQFQKIAEANDDEFYPGTRAAGTEGYADSVDYVAGLLRDAGYDVTLDEFEFPSSSRRCCSSSRRSPRLRVGRLHRHRPAT